MTTRVAIIGCGTIGGFIAAQTVDDPEMELVGVVDPVAEKVRQFADITYSSAAELAAAKPDVVVEAANADVVMETAPHILQFAHMMVLSASAFVYPEFEKKILDLCRASGHNIYIPHGAILGLDGIQDSSEVLESVRVSTTKTPPGLGRDDKVRTVAFEGPTREACRHYPRNINVHAGVAMAGIGFDRTISTVISDPSIKANTHVIEVVGQGFKFKVEMKSEPKGLVTSVYTPVSAFNSMKRLLTKKSGVLLI